MLRKLFITIFLCFCFILPEAGNILALQITIEKTPLKISRAKGLQDLISFSEVKDVGEKLILTIEARGSNFSGTTFKLEYDHAQLIFMGADSPDPGRDNDVFSSIESNLIVRENDEGKIIGSRSLLGPNRITNAGILCKINFQRINPTETSNSRFVLSEAFVGNCDGTVVNLKAVPDSQIDITLPKQQATHIEDNQPPIPSFVPDTKDGSKGCFISNL